MQRKREWFLTGLAKKVCNLAFREPCCPRRVWWFLL